MGGNKLENIPGDVQSKLEICATLAILKDLLKDEMITNTEYKRMEEKAKKMLNEIEE